MCVGKEERDSRSEYDEVRVPKMMTGASTGMLVEREGTRRVQCQGKKRGRADCWDVSKRMDVAVVNTCCKEETEVEDI